ncbi:MAG: peptidase M61 [Microscillaceae bacterium]|jgi:predicted metalloprotease with PDZ domain|nr:peptidase M61 [Microscillaceae bacterium]
MPQISYYLAMPEPHTHYFKVKMRVEDFMLLPDKPYLDFKMAVWTPGSYLVREYARHVEGFVAQSTEALPCAKIDKNTWRVWVNEATKVEVSYWVYAFELTVRTNFLDATHGFVNGAATFMYLPDYQHVSATLLIEPYRDWQKITTSLKPLAHNSWELYVPNFDILVDSPIELGNQTTFSFEAAKIPHHFAVVGLPDFDQAQLVIDLQKIILSAKAFFGSHPCQDYTFIAHFAQQGYGGLEHLDSTVLLYSRQDYRTKEGYTQFLSLCAHEYFHLWNVKRLRPAPLGPFDYGQENFTTLLWQAEGFTSYYEKLILLRAKLISNKDYLKEILKRINAIENQPGNHIQSLAESSLDAWIKAYRPYENSVNSTISYYTKGAVVAMLLDIEIILGSQGKYNLDGVMMEMYQVFYLELNRGFSESEIKAVLEKYAQKDLSEFFQKYIHGTQVIDYQAYFAPLGLEWIVERKDKPDLGITLNQQKITQVKRNSSGYYAGLNVNDELIAIAGKTEEDLTKWLATQKIGDKILFTVRRDGFILPIQVELQASQEVKYTLKKKSELSKTEKLYLRKWLRKTANREDEK